MICPVCKKQIKTKSHIRRIKDNQHIEYVNNQKDLAIKLYKESKNIFEVLNNKNIFLDEYINTFLRDKYKNEILEINRINRNKSISNSRTNINSEKYKMKQEYLKDINTGIENIDYVTCKICGYKGRQLISHLTRIHKINKKQYLKLYPNSLINSYNTNKKIATKLLEITNKHNNTEMNDNSRKFNKNIWGISGCRKDMNEFFRSTWEANFARLLKYYNIEYTYEVIKDLNYLNSKLIYIVDFYLPKYNAYIEVKGAYDKTSQLKIQLFKEQYKERLLIIDSNQYKKLNKKYKNKILNWETGSKEQRRILVEGYENEY